MTRHPFSLRGPEVRALLDGTEAGRVRSLHGGRVELLVPVTLRNSQGGAEDRGRFKLNEAWASVGRHKGLVRGVLTGPVHPHPGDDPELWRGATDNLWPLWRAGDRLWIREAHDILVCGGFEGECVEYGDYYESEEVLYRATPRIGRRRWVTAPPVGQEQPHHIRYLAESTPLDHGPAHYVKHWRPAAKMPRWASRVDLEVLAVRPTVLRLGDDGPERPRKLRLDEHGHHLAPVGWRWWWAIACSVEGER